MEKKDKSYSHAKELLNYDEKGKNKIKIKVENKVDKKEKSKVENKGLEYYINKLPEFIKNNKWTIYMPIQPILTSYLTVKLGPEKYEDFRAFVMSINNNSVTKDSIRHYENTRPEGCKLLCYIYNIYMDNNYILKKEYNILDKDESYIIESYIIERNFIKRLLIFGKNFIMNLKMILSISIC
jgi:hypothetical protein